jgi:sec-independent protein translocase protein TatA
MGSWSITHWLIVLVIVVVIFGTGRLKSAGKDVGDAVREFKKGVRGDDDAPRMRDERRDDIRRDDADVRDRDTSDVDRDRR